MVDSLGMVRLSECGWCGPLAGRNLVIRGWVFAGRALKISNRVSIRALKLSNFERFRTLKTSNRVL